jgi:hypothetical protein
MILHNPFDLVLGDATDVIRDVARIDARTLRVGLPTRWSVRGGS